jgi:hypothetical protein
LDGEGLIFFRSNNRPESDASEEGVRTAGNNASSDTVRTVGELGKYLFRLNKQTIYFNSNIPRSQSQFTNRTTDGKPSVKLEMQISHKKERIE